MGNSKKAVERRVKPLVGKSCGDCPFWIPDLDLWRTPLDRGQCDIDVERPKRTHVRRAMCEMAKQYFPNKRLLRAEKLAAKRTANAEAHGRRSRTVQPLVGGSELKGEQ